MGAGIALLPLQLGDRDCLDLAGRHRGSRKEGSLQDTAPSSGDPQLLDKISPMNDLKAVATSDRRAKELHHRCANGFPRQCRRKRFVTDSPITRLETADQVRRGFLFGNFLKALI